MSSQTIQPTHAIVPGAGGLEKLELAAADGSRLEVYLHGAHVTSWIPAGGDERLFLSRASQFQPGSPIRGGIPVAFPQFGAFGPLPMHGLARLLPWEFAGVQAHGDRSRATFRLHDTEASRRQWPHAFRCELSAAIGGNRLETALRVTNTGAEPFDFTAALHTYFRVSDAAETVVAGLAGTLYRDPDGNVTVDDASQVGFSGEGSRIYFAAPAETRLVEPGRTTVVRQSGFADTVVWNPGPDRCATVPDLEPDDYRRFVCIEAATVEPPAHLEPGERWEGMQELVA